jgi:hypothetical protein
MIVSSPLLDYFAITVLGYVPPGRTDNPSICYHEHWVKGELRTGYGIEKKKGCKKLIKIKSSQVVRVVSGRVVSYGRKYAAVGSRMVVVPFP